MNALVPTPRWGERKPILVSTPVRCEYHKNDEPVDVALLQPVKNLQSENNAPLSLLAAKIIRTQQVAVVQANPQEEATSIRQLYQEQEVKKRAQIEQFRQRVQNRVEESEVKKKQQQEEELQKQKIKQDKLKKIKDAHLVQIQQAKENEKLRQQQEEQNELDDAFGISMKALPQRKQSCQTIPLSSPLFCEIHELDENYNAALCSLASFSKRAATLNNPPVRPVKTKTTLLESLYQFHKPTVPS
eukprot:TRINITY_DN8885_c0_g1_i1.p1 TRINITY_DN8885_c0_g1~~TRINITY_DN8885_c0_g1_i1.p1  ORF type:complete len:244 (+),score=51.14 TRINITY_DN8885_c0_g1_i1:167-898(+)